MELMEYWQWMCPRSPTLVETTEDPSWYFLSGKLYYPHMALKCKYHVSCCFFGTSYQISLFFVCLHLPIRLWCSAILKYFPSIAALLGVLSTGKVMGPSQRRSTFVFLGLCSCSPQYTCWRNVLEEFWFGLFLAPQWSWSTSFLFTSFTKLMKNCLTTSYTIAKARITGSCPSLIR